MIRVLGVMLFGIWLVLAMLDETGDRPHKGLTAAPGMTLYAQPGP